MRDRSVAPASRRLAGWKPALRTASPCRATRQSACPAPPRRARLPLSPAAECAASPGEAPRVFRAIRRSMENREGMIEGTRASSIVALRAGRTLRIAAIAYHWQDPPWHPSGDSGVCENMDVGFAPEVWPRKSGKQLALWFDKMWSANNACELRLVELIPCGSASAAHSTNVPFENVWKVLRSFLIQQLRLGLPIKPAHIKGAIAITNDILMQETAFRKIDRGRVSA